MKSFALAAIVTLATGLGMSAQQVYKPGDKGVTAPVVVAEKKPSYTAAAMRNKIQGSIELTAIIDKEGKPTDIKVVKSLDKENGLDEKAVEALKEWRFKPATKDDKPVHVLVTVEMTFALRDKK